MHVPGQAGMSESGPITGRIPNDFVVRLDQATPDFVERILARRVAAALQGRQPTWFVGQRIQRLSRELDDAYTVPELERALDLLDSVGYGRPIEQRTRRDRNHGHRLHDRLDGIVGQLPRALALRYPTTDDRHASGPLAATDIYGSIAVNHTPRDGHLGVIAAALALWKHRGDGATCHVDLTRGELAYLLRGARRNTRRSGGGDVEWIDGLLENLSSEQITAHVRPGRDGKRSPQHQIPTSAINLIEARLDGEWIPWRVFRDQAAGEPMSGRCGQSDTLRIHLAQWAIEAITQGRAVYLNFGVWRGLSGTGRRLYALLQATTAEQIDGAPGLHFYLADPLRFTLGLRGGRIDKAAAIVRHQLTDLYHRDERYHHQSTDTPSGFRQRKQPGTTIPAFLVRVQANTPSRPRPGWRDKAPTPRRPLCARGPHALCPTVSPYDVTPAQIPAALKRERGFDAARRHIAQIRATAISSIAAGDRAGGAQLQLHPPARTGSTPGRRGRTPGRERGRGDPPGR